MKAQFIWNSASLEPTAIDEPILAWTNNDKLLVFKNTKSFINGNPYSNWKWLSDKYNIKFWVYQFEVINEH